jgi:hypothetical protein
MFLGPSTLRLRYGNRRFENYIIKCSGKVPLVIDTKSCRRGVCRTMAANNAIGVPLPGNRKNITVQHMLFSVAPLLNRWEGPVRLCLNDALFRVSEGKGKLGNLAWYHDSDHPFSWLKNVNHLQELSLHTSYFSGPLVCFLYYVLRDCGRALRSLSWCIPGYQSVNFTVFSLLQVFSQLTLLPRLEELRLKHVCVTNGPVPYFCVTPFTSLRTLVLEDLRMGDQECRWFTSALWGFLPQSLEEVTLTMNSERHFLEVQLQGLPNLKALHLGGFRIRFAGDTMRMNLENLVHLSLSDADFETKNETVNGTVQAQYALKLFLGRVLHLKSLALRDVIYCNWVFKQVATEIRKMTHLENLVLDEVNKNNKAPFSFISNDLEELNLGQKPDLKIFVAWGHTGQYPAIQ